MPRPPVDPVERFWSKVRVVGCWEFDAYHDSDGYALFSRRHGFTVRAHRYAYELLVGPIPEGLELDHLCRNRGCVNPSHLEPVTTAENQARGEKATAARCQAGHPFNEENKVDSLPSIVWARRALRTGAARSIREAAGVSAGEFAAGVGVSPSAVSRWERGKRTPRAAEAERVAHALKALMAEDS